MATQKELMQSAKAYIDQKQYADARRILRKVDHPKAKAWLRRIDEIEPPKMKHEHLWENSPTCRYQMIGGLVISGVACPLSIIWLASTGYIIPFLCGWSIPILIIVVWVSIQANH